MNSVHTNLINYLSASIHGNKIKANINNKKSIFKILQEADAHNIKGLIYCGISNMKDLEFIDKALIDSWKKETFMTGIIQIKHINQIRTVLIEMKRQDIPVIALKGLFLRDLYPRPEQRTMCDSDILIHKEDLDKVRYLLISMGYEESKEATPAHVSFEHKEHLPIEVHWTLGDSRYINDISNFENEVWERAVVKKIGDASVLCLCDEDFIIHLCIHMAVHMRSGGFGLRQLCDLTLFMNKSIGTINWSKFSSKLKAVGIEKFTLAIFKVCTQILNMAVPEKFKDSIIKIDQRHINLLIEDIISSGVHGNRNLEQVFSSNLVNASVVFKTETSSKMRSVINIIFPPINTLSDNYFYAKKNKLLTPIAWIHHFIAGVFNNHYTLLDKLNFLLFSNSTFKTRTKLIKDLGL